MICNGCLEVAVASEDILCDDCAEYIARRNSRIETSAEFLRRFGEDSNMQSLIRSNPVLRTAMGNLDSGMICDLGEDTLYAIRAECAEIANNRRIGSKAWRNAEILKAYVGDIL